MFNADYKKISTTIVDWIGKTVRDAGFKQVVIALSGGVDSAVSTALCVKALRKENVHVVFLPYGDLNRQATEDAALIAKTLRISKRNIHLFTIEETTSVILNEAFTLEGKDLDKVRAGNIMARVRMTYLFDLAKQLKALVCGTENKTEYYLGYFTRFGDEASDLEPIRNVYKTHVWELARYLGIPEKIIQKAPTAGLWKGQTDEGEFGFSYKDADMILYYFFDKKLSEKEIVGKGVKRDIVRKVLKRVKENEFKHKLPYIL